jgi:D-beta-D-heptose 7-phosphate kinase/D-beta-D-heptose 1-phosphate adenosyltransferase
MSDSYEKICDWQEAKQRIEIWKQAGQRIGFTNGCFDILHAGHVRYLQDSATQADRLIVGLNSDSSVQTLKGRGRPIVPELDRAYVLSGLGAVAAVIIFEEETPLQLIEWLKPDLLMKGGDYRAEDIVGYDSITTRGGVVKVLPFLSGRSTTNIVQRIRELTI